MRKLPAVDFVLPAGLNTTYNPELVNGRGLRRSDNADGDPKYLSWGKVAGSTRKSDNFLAPVYSLHMFEYFDAASDLQRTVVALSGNSLWTINTDMTLTRVGNVITNEAMRAVTVFDRLHLASPNNVPVKFDGNTAVRWGVLGPGQDEKVFQDMNASASWTPTNGTVANSTTSIDGGGSVSLAKTNAATTEMYITRAGTGQNLVGFSDSLYFWLLIPQGALQKLRNTDYCLELRIGNAGLGNSNKYQFDRGQLLEGWNLIACVLDSPTAITGTGATLTAIDTWRFSFYTEQVAQLFSGMLLDKVLVTDQGFIVPSVLSNTGGVTGNVSYRVTYVTAHGVESNAGPPSVTITVPTAGRQVLLNAIPVSTDPQVISRRIYRDEQNDSLWRFITQINDNSTVAYTDTVSNDARGLTQPPLAASDLNDHSPPEPMSDIVEWKEHIFGINANNPFQLDISLLRVPDAFPLLYSRQFAKQLTGFEVHERGLIIYTSDGELLVRGDSFATFFFDEIHPSIGCAGPRAHARANTAGVTLHDDGLYSIDTFQPWYLSSQVNDLFKDLEPTELANAHVVHDRGRFRVVIFARATVNGDYDRIYAWSYGKKGAGSVSETGAGVDALDIRKGDWSRIVLPANMNPLCSEAVEQSADRPELWIGCDDGFVYRLQDPDRRNYADGVLDRGIATVIETVSARMGSTIQMEGRPRYLEISGSSLNGSTWTATVMTFNGGDGENSDALATKSKTFTFLPGSNSVTLPLGLMRQGSWVRLKLENSAVGEDAMFHNCQILYVERQSRGARGSG